MFKKSLVLGLIFLWVCFSLGFAQEFSMPADFYKQQEEYLNNLKKENPKLYEFEKRLMDIQAQMQKIIENYQNKKITKDKAKESLAPLLKEEIELRQNPDYLVEQRLNILLQPLPEPKQ